MFFNVALIIFDKQGFGYAVLPPIKSIISVALHLTNMASEADDLIAVAELVIVP